MADAIRAGFRPGDGDHLPAGIRPHDLLFRAVHPDLCDMPPLFPQALNYYRWPVPFLQVVWPDANGVFPAEAGCVAGCAAAQPDLTQPDLARHLAIGHKPGPACGAAGDDG